MTDVVPVVPIILIVPIVLTVPSVPLVFIILIVLADLVWDFLLVYIFHLGPVIGAYGLKLSLFRLTRRDTSHGSTPEVENLGCDSNPILDLLICLFDVQVLNDN